MLQAIKNFFKRTTIVNHYHQTASAVVWDNTLVVALPCGEVYIVHRDLDGQESIRKMRLGY